MLPNLPNFQKDLLNNLFGQFGRMCKIICKSIQPGRIQFIQLVKIVIRTSSQIFYIILIHFVYPYYITNKGKKTTSENSEQATCFMCFNISLGIIQTTY